MTAMKIRESWYEAVAIPSAELCRHQHETYEEAENCDRWGRPAALLVTKVEVTVCGYRWGSPRGTDDHRDEQHECARPAHAGGNHVCGTETCNARKPTGKKERVDA